MPLWNEQRQRWGQAWGPNPSFYKQGPSHSGTLLSAQGCPISPHLLPDPEVSTTLCSQLAQEMLKMSIRTMQGSRAGS